MVQSHLLIGSVTNRELRLGKPPCDFDPDLTHTQDSDKTSTDFDGAASEPSSSWTLSKGEEIAPCKIHDRLLREKY